MNEEFRCTDVDLCAFLRCRGLRYTRLELNPTNSRLTDFVFDTSPELFELLREWASEDDEERLVNAREFGHIRQRMFKRAQAFARRAG